MAITLDHTIVPAKDNEASARFFADIMGLHFEGSDRHFAPVRVNDTLTLDFCNAETFEGHHLAFHVGEEEFDAIVGRITARGLSYGNDPHDPSNRKTDHPFGGRGVYFTDPNGHLLEAMTQVEHPAS